MAKRLNADDIEAIGKMLDTWTGPLTWQMLINAIEVRMRRSFTRQALHRHVRIRTAFQTHKRVKDEIDETSVSGIYSGLLQKNSRLEAEVNRLKVEADALLKQFLVWSHNAHRHGLTEELLNLPLPKNLRR